MPAYNFASNALGNPAGNENGYQAIVCSFGLEQCLDPVEVLHCFEQSLVPGGRLFLEFTDHDFPVTKLLSWLSSSRCVSGEVYQFSGSHVQRMLAQAGFGGGRQIALSSMAGAGTVDPIGLYFDLHKPGKLSACLLLRRLLSSVIVMEKNLEG